MGIELQRDIPEPEAAKGLEALLGDVAAACFEAEGVENAGFAVRVTDDQAIRRMNRETRGIDRATDVLSFPTVQFPRGKTARRCPKRLRREYDPYLGYCNLGD